MLAFPTGRLPLDNMRLELSEPPAGIAVESTTAQGASVAAVISTDASKVKPGLKGNLIFNAYQEWSSPSADGQPKTTRRSPFGLLPAVPFEVVAPKGSGRKPPR